MTILRCDIVQRDTSLIAHSLCGSRLAVELDQELNQSRPLQLPITTRALCRVRLRRFFALFPLLPSKGPRSMDFKSPRRPLVYILTQGKISPLIPLLSQPPRSYPRKASWISHFGERGSVFQHQYLAARALTPRFKGAFLLDRIGFLAFSGLIHKEKIQSRSLYPFCTTSARRTPPVKTSAPP